MHGLPLLTKTLLNHIITSSIGPSLNSFAATTTMDLYSTPLLPQRLENMFKLFLTVALPINEAYILKPSINDHASYVHYQKPRHTIHLLSHISVNFPISTISSLFRTDTLAPPRKHSPNTHLGSTLSPTPSYITP